MLFFEHLDGVQFVVVDVAGEDDFCVGSSTDDGDWFEEFHG